MEELSELRQRIERLERENQWRRLGVLAALAVVVLAAAALLTWLPGANARDSVVEAERVVIRDASGKVRAVLGVETPNRGWPQMPASMSKGEKQYQPAPELGLFLYDEDGAEVAHLTDWGGAGALLQLAGQEQQALASMHAGKGFSGVDVSAKRKGSTTLFRELDALMKRAEREKWDDARGKPALDELFRETSLGLGARGGDPFGFSLLGKGENGHVYLGGGKPTSPISLRLLDRQHRYRAVLELSDDGAPSLEMSDVNGNSRAVLGRGALTTVRPGATQQRSESSLVLFDKGGKVIWKAP